MGAVAIAFLLAGAAFGQVQKTAADAFDFSVDFGAKLAQLPTHGIVLVSATAVKAPANTDSSSALIAASPVPAVVGGTAKVVLRLQGGVFGETHRISVKVRDSVTGEIWEALFTVAIVNSVNVTTN